MNSINKIISDNYFHIILNNRNTIVNLFHLFYNLILGQGAYGKVYFGISLKEKAPVAIKVLNKNNLNELTAYKEKQILINLKKFNLTPLFYELFPIDNKLYLIESLHGPDLRKLKKFCGGSFSKETVYHIGADLLFYIEYVHNVGYLHYDIKDDNVILLTNPMEINKHLLNFTLIDYGLSVQYVNFSNNNNYINKFDH